MNRLFKMMKTCLKIGSSTKMDRETVPGQSLLPGGPSRDTIELSLMIFGTESPHMR